MKNILRVTGILNPENHTRDTVYEYDSKEKNKTAGGSSYMEITG